MGWLEFQWNELVFAANEMKPYRDLQGLVILILLWWLASWLMKRRLEGADSRMPENLPLTDPVLLTCNAAAKQTPLGEVLRRRGLISSEQLAEGLELQSKWGSRLGDIVLSMGWVKPLVFYRALAEHFTLRFVNLLDAPVDAALMDQSKLLHYADCLYLPWRNEGGVTWFATADPGRVRLDDLRELHGEVGLVMTSKFDVLWELQRVAGERFSQQAVFHLAERSSEHSASVVATQAQKKALLAVIFLGLASFWLAPLWVAIGLNALMNFFLFGSFLFRTLLCWMSCSENIGMIISDEEVQALDDRDLPLYTILVPMYKEPDVLPILAAALRRMDYPRSKLDIKLVLEAGDSETIEAAKALGLEASFEIIRVPHSLPKTKPKACNYALHLARGHYLTIYDAEDKPEPDQLKKVVVAFKKLGDSTACVQARLNYFNAEENWLTRMFTLEYSLWFDMFLPALDQLRVPIPLGGTSNHFDLAKLRQVGAWDPFNVTEDADLGLRFAALGYRVGVVNSVTYEEANSQVGNWIRQRSRWIKGYMQTWLVNMRDPVALIRRVGIKGFLGDFGGLSAAIFVYVMLWVFEAYQREPKLQPLATAALLISLGGFAKPALAIAFVLLSIAFFLLNRRLPEGGTLGFALLLFTPAALSGGAIVVFSLFTGGPLAAIPLAHTPLLVNHSLIYPASHSTENALLMVWSAVRFFSFPIVVLLSRLFARSSGPVDIAFAMMLAIVVFIGRAPWMPQALQESDIWFISIGGAAALLALAPPKALVYRALVLAGTVAATFATLSNRGG